MQSYGSKTDWLESNSNISEYLNAIKHDQYQWKYMY